jgi:hypothetical protein
MKIQCATCINEQTTIEQITKIHPGQKEFNNFYSLYQHWASFHKCTDYMSVFFPTPFEELDSF